MKTLKDFEIKEKKIIEIDLNNYKDSFFSLSLALTSSLLTLKKIKVRNLNFINERILSLIQVAKIVSKGKANIQEDVLEFEPKEIDYSIKEFEYLNCPVQDIIVMLFPILMFSPKQKKFLFKGITEYKKSIDYFGEFILPYVSKFVNANIKILKRSFIADKPGEVELSIRPKFEFNKNIYDKKVDNDFDSIIEFIGKIKTDIPDLNFDLKSNLQPLIIRGKIYAAYNFEDFIINDIYNMVKLILKNTKKSVDLTPEFSKDSNEGISVTIYAVLSEEMEMDFTLKNSIFNILGKSIVYNKINFKTQERIIRDVEKLIQDMSNLKQRYKDLDENLIIYSTLFGKPRKSNHSKLLSKFFNYV